MDFFKRIIGRGTTYGALGALAVSGTVAASSATATHYAGVPDVSALPPAMAMWVVVATLVIQTGVELLLKYFPPKNGGKK